MSHKVTGDTVRRLRYFFLYKTQEMLVKTLIILLIDYGDVCFVDLNAELLNIFHRLNNCIRLIYNHRRYDHVSSYHSQLKWLSIRQLYVLLDIVWESNYSKKLI